MAIGHSLKFYVIYVIQGWQRTCTLKSIESYGYIHFHALGNILPIFYESFLLFIFRFAAVHYPINFSQAMNDPKALKQRMVRYALPVCLLTIVLNICKFFETTYGHGKTYFIEHVLTYFSYN